MIETVWTVLGFYFGASREGHGSVMRWFGIGSRAVCAGVTAAGAM